VIFYIDGVARPAAAYDPGFSFGTTPAIGARGDNLAASFYGELDEMSFYNRALSASEIQQIAAASVGKCPPNNPPSARNFTLGAQQNQSVSVLADKFLQFASDPDGDPLALYSVSAASTNGGAVLLGTNIVIYSPATNYVGSDRFTYTVADGRGGQASAFVLVTVVSQNQASGNMFAPQPITGGYRVGFLAVPGRTYTLQRATNINGPWTTLASVTTLPSGLGMFDDTNSPPVNAFYRTVYP
jgi:hypothetical protein